MEVRNSKTYFEGLPQNQIPGLYGGKSGFECNRRKSVPFWLPTAISIQKGHGAQTSKICGAQHAQLYIGKYYIAPVCKTDLLISVRWLS